MVMIFGWVPGPGIAAFIGFAAQAKLDRLESSSHTLPFGFNPDDATRTQGIRV